MTVQVQLGTPDVCVAIDAAIVDLDGTMVDTMGDFAAAIDGMLHDLQLPALPVQAIAHMVGKGTEHLLRSVLAHVLATPGAAADVVAAGVAQYFAPAQARYQHHYLAINGQHAQVYPGVQAGLRALREAGVRLACVTNKPLAFTTPLLAAKGLDDLFDHVFGGDSFAHKKPHPLPLLQACAALGTQPARTLMIGDSSNDAQAGHAAQCPVLLVSYGYNHGVPIRAVPAAAYVDSLAQLQVQGRTSA